MPNRVKLFDEDGLVSEPNGTESWAVIEVYDDNRWLLWDSTVGQTAPEAMIKMRKTSKQRPLRLFRVSTTIVIATTTKSDVMQNGKLLRTEA